MPPGVVVEGGGTDWFDAAFIVKTTDEAKAQAVLNSLERLIRTIPDEESFGIKGRRFWGGRPPPGVMELSLVDVRGVESSRGLEGRLELFTATMEALHRHGAASEGSLSVG